MAWLNKHVLITGASSGIGAALARQAAKEGAKVGLMARREDRLKEIAEELRMVAPQVECVWGDVSDRASVANAVFELEKKLGPVDVLIANAGVGSTNPADNLKVEEAEYVFRVNLFGVLYCIGAVLPGMLQRRGGQIAAISSLASYKGMPGAAAYSASKAAVNVYMESLRIQLRKSGVRFTTICPGFIETPMTESNQGMILVMKADEAARRIVHAIQAKRKVYNFPWVTTRLAKMSRWLPDWLVGAVASDQVGGKGAETGLKEDA